jgi:hypothetical protein
MCQYIYIFGDANIELSLVLRNMEITLSAYINSELLARFFTSGIIPASGHHLYDYNAQTEYVGLH